MRRWIWRLVIWPNGVPEVATTDDQADKPWLVECLEIGRRRDDMRAS
jgi:hypothetical protein